MPTSSPRKLRVVAPATNETTPAKGTSMRIAFATQDLKTLDAHFAGARNLAIYEVDADSCRLVEAVRFDAGSNEDGVHADVDEDRITPRVDAIEGCALLFVLAIGGPAAAKVVNRRIHPVKVPQPEPIDQVIERVQTMLRTAPPPWLRKAMGGGVPKRFDFLEGDRETLA